MTITQKDVLHVAALANLSLEDDEVESMKQDLASVLGYVQLLDELDLDGVKPTSHVAVECAPLRKDDHQSGLSAEVALREAPRTSASGFAVPGFVDEG
jgi:aspartyl-tRNA(Asn)/glutamyl-tRNA(Gln) amidotransferase subunit C